MPTVYIKENSYIAKQAAMFRGEPRIAMVLCNTIYLWNVSKKDFMASTKWLRHEVAHIQQFKKHGSIRFICLYLFETFNKGYQYNCYELEAIQKEQDATILNGIQFV
jgi:hypothetical protein